MPVSIAVVVYVLTGVSILIVLFTRRAQRRTQVRASRSTRSSTSGIVTVYTTAGLLAGLGWLLFLASPDDSPTGHPLVGVVGLFFWWITALVGLRMMSGRRPRGRHSAPVEQSARSGRGLLVVGQLVLLLVVGFFTWAYTTAAV
jgi:heme/copper-type cytochrome/quinol oxidase subunit 2